MNTDKEFLGLDRIDWLVLLIMIIAIILSGCSSYPDGATAPVYSPVPGPSRWTNGVPTNVTNSTNAKPAAQIELPPEPPTIHPADRIQNPEISQAVPATKVLPVILENPDRGPLWAQIVQNERVTEPMERWRVASEFLAEPGTNNLSLPMTNASAFYRARWKQ